MTSSRGRVWVGLALAAAIALGTVAGWASAAEHHIVVYYLYKMPRCDTCLRIEAYAQEAVDSSFADELEAGTIEWHACNTDLPEYAHYWTEFEVDVKSLIMVETCGGEMVRWKNCEKVWDMVDDKPAFLDYVRGEVKAYLDGE